jgi:hypothetical protein
MNACSPAANDAVDGVAALLAGVDAADVAGDAAAVVRTEAIWTVAAVLGVVEVLDDAVVGVVAAALIAPVNVLSGTAGAGGASKRMNNAKLVMSELKVRCRAVALAPVRRVDRALRLGSGCALRGRG